MADSEIPKKLPVEEEQIRETSEKSFDDRIQEVRKMLEDARKAPTVNWIQYNQAVRGKALLWQRGIEEGKIIKVRIVTEGELGSYTGSDAFIYVKESMPEDLLRLNVTHEGASSIVSPETKARFMSYLMEVREAEKLHGIAEVGRAFFVNESVVDGIRNEELKASVESQINAFLSFVEVNIHDLEKISKHIDEINLYIKELASHNYGVSLGDIFKPIQ